MASSNRSKFLEMCEGLLARVEPPLRSVLEQASKWGCVGGGVLRADRSQPECRFPLHVGHGDLPQNNFLFSSYKIKKLSHTS